MTTIPPGPTGSGPPVSYQWTVPAGFHWKKLTGKTSRLVIVRETMTGRESDFWHSNHNGLYVVIPHVLRVMERRA